MKKSRPETLEGKVTKLDTGYGNLYVTMSELDGELFEVFCTLGKSGASTAADAEAIGRLISLLLRYNIPPKEVVSQLSGIGGGTPFPYKDRSILSIPDGIAIALNNYIKEKEDDSKL